MDSPIELVIFCNVTFLATSIASNIFSGSRIGIIGLLIRFLVLSNVRLSFGRSVLVVSVFVFREVFFVLAVSSGLTICAWFES